MFGNLEFQIDTQWASLPESAKQKIEALTGINWGNHATSYYQKLVAIHVAAGYLKDARSFQQHAELKRELVDRFVQGVGDIFSQYAQYQRQTQLEAADRIKDAIESGIDKQVKAYQQQADAIKIALEDAVKKQGLSESQLPAAVTGEMKINVTSVSDCVYQHPEVNSPNRCVMIYDDSKGTYAQCTIPKFAYQRTFFGWHWLSGGTLQSAGCPLDSSRGLISRFFPWGRCNLADGKLHELTRKPGYDSVWPLASGSR